MSVLFLDPVFEKQVRKDREQQSADRWDEVWEGVLVVPPSPNNEHFRLVMKLSAAFSAVIDWDRGDQAAPGGNVSDRDQDWAKNYRVPDALVYLTGSPAVDRNTHWVGGPDFVVEIISPGEAPHKKFDFYAKIGTRELLIVDRDPWQLELYQLKKSQLHLAGCSDLSNRSVLASTVLPLTFQLLQASPRPIIHIAHTSDGRTWTA